MKCRLFGRPISFKLWGPSGRITKGTIRRLESMDPGATLKTQLHAFSMMNDGKSLHVSPSVSVSLSGFLPRLSIFLILAFFEFSLLMPFSFGSYLQRP